MEDILMRNLIYPFIATIAIFALWIGTGQYTSQSVPVMYEYIQNVYDCSADGDWKTATLSMDAFMDCWNKSKNKFSIYIHEKNLEDIEVAAGRCKGYVQAENTDLTLGEASSLLKELDLLKNHDSIRVEEIF